MIFKQIGDELERIHCSYNFVGNIEGLETSNFCPDGYIQIYNDMELVLIPKSEIDNLFEQLPDGCGLRVFFETVKNNPLCKYVERIYN